MSKSNSNKVRNWPRVDARIHPETNEKLKAKLKKTGDNQSELIRKAIRDYTRD
jgi:predicted DNA-binding protein